MLKLQWCNEEWAAGGACVLILSLQAFESHKAEFKQNAGALRVVSPVLKWRKNNLRLLSLLWIVVWS